MDGPFLLHAGSHLPLLAAPSTFRRSSKLKQRNKSSSAAWFTLTLCWSLWISSSGHSWQERSPADKDQGSETLVAVTALLSLLQWVTKKKDCAGVSAGTTLSRGGLRVARPGKRTVTHSSLLAELRFADCWGFSRARPPCSVAQLSGRRGRAANPPTPVRLISLTPVHQMWGIWGVFLPCCERN